MEELTNISPIGMYFTLVMAILFIVLPRKYALVPLLMTALYLTQGQVMVIASLHFTMLRIMILVGFVRIAMRREYDHVKLNTIDSLLILYVIATIITQAILWQTSSDFIYRLGFAYHVLGIYFLFRCLIKDYDDFRILLKIMAFIIVPLTVAILMEMSTGRNIFSIFGGVPEFSELRKWTFRCQGPFRSPILAGTFGATLMPLFIALWFKNGHGNKNRMTSIIGFTCATIIAIASTSSGPLMAYLFAIIGLLTWFFKDHMRAIRWGILFSLITLHLIMKAPVWFLMARISEILGGGGWHRAELVDQAIRHFDEWWLLGTKVTEHWMGQGLAVNPDSADITNHFVGVGIHGGVISLILFIFIIIYCFKRIGVSLQLMKNVVIDEKMILWTLGVAVFAHIISFMSVSYFDQIIVFWYMVVAVISSLTAPNSLHFRKQNKEILA
jgi:hypothetical protein